jgi:D-sedoheptulose 7-phosphate isomerase
MLFNRPSPTLLKKKGKILLAGNGGSAGDAQHIAAEFIGRFKTERRALPAIALTTDTSILTAVGNDYGYEEIFSRQVEGLCLSEDCFIGISTSGNSPNIIKAFSKAKEIGALTIGITGGTGGKMKKIKELCDHIFIVPSNDTARIQEMHIFAGHAICELIDKKTW